MNEIATTAAPYDGLVEDRVDCDAIQKAFLEKLFYVQGKFPKLATLKDYYLALAYTVRDLMLRRWVSTAATYTATRARTVAYFSAEYLLGPQLGNNLINLGIYDQVKHAIEDLGLDFDRLLAEEPEPGLGNRAITRREIAPHLDLLERLIERARAAL